jgi:hypothetical protein
MLRLIVNKFHKEILGNIFIFGLIFVFSNSVKSDELAVTDLNIANYISSINKKESSMLMNNKSPSPLIFECAWIDDGRLQAPKTMRKSKEELLVEKILVKYGSHHASQLFYAAPDYFMWWIRFFQKITIQSIGAAIHETNHQIDLKIGKCDNTGGAKFLINGKIFRTSLKFGNFEPYSVLDRNLPDEFKVMQLSRYPQYIKRSGLQKNSDITALLMELGAYLGAASFEIEVAKRNNLNLIASDITAYDGNLGGTVDFMLYLLAYLKTLRMDYPSQYDALISDKAFINLTQNLWSASEEVILSSIDVTKYIDEKNVMTFSSRVLSSIYSENFIGELDEVQINHKSREYWCNSFSRSPTFRKDFTC